MPELTEPVLWLHIAFGSAGLFTGSLIMVLRKGDCRHRKLGLVFLVAMLGIFLSSVLLSLQRGNVFLLCIGFFSFYLAASGWRILQLKTYKRLSQPPDTVDYLLAAAGIGAGLFMLLLSWKGWQRGDLFGMVPAVFGAISAILAWQGLRIFRVPPGSKSHWLRSHSLRMAGAFVSTVTAFIVVNVQQGPGWLWWLLPTAIILPAARWQLQRYMARPSRTVHS